MLHRVAALALSAIAVPAFAADRQATPATAEAPAAIPADVERFAADFSAAMTSQDVDRIMSFYSKRYLHDGMTWKVRSRFVALVAPKISYYWVRFSEFKPIDKNRATITAHSAVNGLPERKGPDYQIVREHGKWRWLGNQRKEQPEARH